MWGDIGEIYARCIAALTVVHEVPRLRDVAPAVAHLARENLLVRRQVLDIRHLGRVRLVQVADEVLVAQHEVAQAPVVGFGLALALGLGLGCG